MSAEPVTRSRPGPRVRRPPARASDTELLAWHRAGDERAFDALCDRHRRRLTAYAQRILRTRPEVVEDVVQESLWRAHRALRRDDRHIEVQPYMFRLVRNCCLDELGRTRGDSVALHTLLPGDEPQDAAGSTWDQVARRDATATLLADVADLPSTQRHALLRREVDGLSHERIARELGISVAASKGLVHRAREGLVRTAEARDTRCLDIRHDLLLAHDAGHRPPMRALRHVVGCAACREFRAEVKSGRRSLQVLVPGPALLVLGGGVLAKVSGAAAGGAKPALVKGAAIATTATVAVGGVVGVGYHVFRAGQPTPLPLQGAGVPGGALRAGAPVPPHMAVVTRRLTTAPGTPTVSGPLTCPDGMRVAGLVPAGAPGVPHGLDPRTVIGASRTARVVVSGASLGGAPRSLTVAILCRDPDGHGSVRARAASVGGRPVVFACRRRTNLLAHARGAVAKGTVTEREPLAVLGVHAKRLRVRTDAGAVGWLPTDVAC